ncbi:MAG: 4'-phosphopantetheinyl transferase superfamily protein [Acidobacteriota bacterium]
MTKPHIAQAQPLDHDDVHLWWTDLRKSGPAGVVAAGRVLSPDEHARAARFVRAQDRYRFILARGMLRLILARYTGCRPEQVTFEYLTHGKPRLAEPACDLHFNLSHSDDFVLCACTRGRQVGVDVEGIRPVAHLAGLALAAFSRAEHAAWSALEADSQLLGFFNCWTRKEAYVKARGDGLSMPLDAFDVSLTPGEAAALLAHRLEPAEVDRWSVSAVYPAERCVGAVVVQGQVSRISVRRWRFPGNDETQEERE